jgi:hypothetical protein
MDIHTPRQNQDAEFKDLFGEDGDYRIIRAEEAYARLTPEGPASLEALGANVIIKREQFERTVGGLYIPDTVEDPNRNGVCWWRLPDTCISRRSAINN